MPVAQFRFYGELNDFLPKEKRETLFIYPFEDHQSIKHLIEARGIPHPEVGLIWVNGSSRDLSSLIKEGDLVEVFPISQGTLNHDDFPQSPRFILDNHLGRLAAYLRMLGFDCLYRNDYEDEELAMVASQEGRILLTRDIRLLMRRTVRYGYWVRVKNPRLQIVEVLKRYRLFDEIVPFRRCLRCNGQLRLVPKEEVLDRLETLTRQYFDEFHLCPDCSQVYWKGSHWERMQKFIQNLKVTS
jgi:hypothetical protein